MLKDKYKAIDIANWFLWKNAVEKSEIIDNSDGEEVYEGITHLKLQKLIYFAQGIYLAYTDNALFKEKIQAWQHGPVVPNVYSLFSVYGKDEISKKLSKEELDTISQIEKDNDISMVLNYVYNNFGIYTAWQLREISHEVNGPWDITVKEKGLNSEIDKKLMKNYFKKYVSEA